jgi:arabinogalactan endo-1,4-beta-galactosidase
MKNKAKDYRTAISLIAVALFVMSCISIRAELVFQDDFSEPDGTMINGKPADTGGPWSSVNAANQVNGNAFIQIGANSIAPFTRALGAGETLTITIVTGSASQFTGSGWTGITIRQATGGDSINIGDYGGSNVEWSETAAYIGTSDTSAPNTVTITYVHDTGAWSIETAALPGTASGTGTAGLALQELLLWDDGSGGSALQYQSITAEISATVSPQQAIPYVDWAVSNQLATGRYNDEDGDGLLNLHEYAVKGDPTNSADQGFPSFQKVESDDGTNWLYYTYPKRAGAENDVEYSLWLSTNLTSNIWVSSDYEQLGTGTNAYADGFDAVTNRIDTTTQSSRFVRLGINSASPDEWRGGDISMIPRFEELGGQYKIDGQVIDPIHIMMNYGMNIFRVRLFVVPDGAWDGAIQDLAYVEALGQRIKDAGALFLLDIHYSDTWADPGHQDKPAAWADLSFSELEAQVETYSSNVIATLKAAGCLPDIVQVGNEITGGFLWPEGKIYEPGTNRWEEFTTLLKAGIEGVQQPLSENEDIGIMVHIDRGGDLWSVTNFYHHLEDYNVEYDIIGLSYYPWWHGNLAALQNTLTTAANTFGKEIVVVETAFAWKNGTYDYASTQWDVSPQGQRQFLKDVMQTVRNVPNGLGKGVVWWYPEAVNDVPIGVWENGANGLFDDSWNALPALEAF